MAKFYKCSSIGSMDEGRGVTFAWRSLRSSFLRFFSSRARCFSHSISFTSSCLKGHCDGMPGSLGAFSFLPDFLRSFAFFLWCSLTFFMTLYFCLSVVRFDFDFLLFFGIVAIYSQTASDRFKLSEVYASALVLAPSPTPRIVSHQGL